MTIRRMTKAQEIEMLKTDLETKKGFLASAVAEAESLHLKELSGKASKKDQKRAGELVEICNDLRKFIERGSREVREYYKPTYIAG